MTRSPKTLCGTVAAAALLSAMTFTSAAAADEVLAAATQPALAVATPDAGAAQPAATVDRDQQRIKSLHDRLQITPEQESLWNDVARIMRSNDDIIDALAQDRAGKAATMTAIDDLHSYAKISAAHATGVKTFTPAFEALYKNMSAAQKANADNVFRHDGTKEHKQAL